MSLRKSSRKVDYKDDGGIQFRRVQKKTPNKIEFNEKLQIIAAVEKGQTKVDIGKEFGIQARAVAYIYKQKDTVLRKYKQKFSADVDCKIDFSQCLLNWFVKRLNTNRAVKEKDIKIKAEQLAHSIKLPDFKFTNEWFLTFRLCHNIVKQRTNVEGQPNQDDCLKWSRIIDGFEESDIYVAGTCALLYMENLHSFLSSSLNIEKFVSVLLLTNISGSNKHRLVVVGSEAPQTLTQSLPLLYYHKQNAQFDNLIISKILKDWDTELKINNRKIMIAFHVPDSYLDEVKLEQIKILRCSDLTYVNKTFDRIVRCFKYHYRKLQIMQTFSFRKEEADFMDYIRMLSLAWHSVSPVTIRHIFHPRFQGCFYFNTLEKHQLEHEENDQFNLTQWCAKHGVPLKLETAMLDSFTTCDTDIPSLDLKHNRDSYSHCLNINDWLAQGDIICHSISAVDTFQAMKRLLRYAHSESAPSQIIDSVRMLEDQLEYEACVEVQQSIDKDSTNHI